MIIKSRTIEKVYVTPGKLRQVLEGLKKQYTIKKVIKRMNDDLDTSLYPEGKVIVFGIGHTGKEYTICTNFYKCL